MRYVQRRLGAICAKKTWRVSPVTRSLAAQMVCRQQSRNSLSFALQHVRVHYVMQSLHLSSQHRLETDIQKAEMHIARCSCNECIGICKKAHTM
jgi:hypothetical protein